MTDIWTTNQNHKSYHAYHESRGWPTSITFRMNFKHTSYISLMSMKIAPQNTLVAKHGAYVNMPTWIMCTNWLQIHTKKHWQSKKRNAGHALQPLYTSSFLSTTSHLDYLFYTYYILLPTKYLLLPILTTTKHIQTLPNNPFTISPFVASKHPVE